MSSPPTAPRAGLNRAAEHPPGAGANFGPMVVPLREDPKLSVSAPGYRPPVWLDRRAVRGKARDLEMRILGRHMTVHIWSPAAGELPLLVAHDGPEYNTRAALTHYAGAMIERGALPPFRVALLPPGSRDEWYSASAAYGRALCSRILPALRDQVGVAGAPVGMGASLGALAMLQAQRSWPGTFAGLFLQSGSFYIPRFNRHESGFLRFGRIVRFVGDVLRAPSHSDPVPVVMTCGAEEDNLHNNRLMVSALAVQGYSARLHEVPGSHDFMSWRDALHPHLTRLLARLWTLR
jgi:enterochelin esterase-like enzyme